MGIEATTRWLGYLKGSSTEDLGPNSLATRWCQVPDDAAVLVRALPHRGPTLSTPAVCDTGLRLPPRYHADVYGPRRSARTQPDPASAEVGVPATSHRGPTTWHHSAGHSGRARSWCRPTNRSSGSPPPASSSTSCGCPASSSHAPTREAANLIDSRADERTSRSRRDQARRTAYKSCFLAMVRRFTNCSWSSSMRLATASTRCRRLLERHKYFRLGLRRGHQRVAGGRPAVDGIFDRSSRVRGGLGVDDAG